MYENIFVKDKAKDGLNNSQPALTELRAAQTLLEHNRAQGLAALNSLFRNGTPPKTPLDGRYHGELVGLDIAPGLTQLFDWITGMWMPWLGKTFDASHQTGDNIFARDSYPVARFFNPFYRGFRFDEMGTYHGFAFHTYTAPGLADPDRQVLKIDYNLKENPLLTVRRVLDELVQVDDNLYLGKAHVRWWWGPASGWQLVAYFMLTRNIASGSS
ncbi:MAG TPA: hypothetical protein VF896_04845 [Anaerolineales bacterium]